MAYVQRRPVISEAEARMDLGIQLAPFKGMRNSTIPATVLFVSIAITPALAQRAPAPGMGAIGGSIGASLPRDPSLDKGLDLAVNIEGYLTSRVSVRGQLGGSWWD